MLSQASVQKTGVVFCADDRYSKGGLYRLLNIGDYCQFTRVGAARHFLDRDYACQFLIEEIASLKEANIEINFLIIINHFSDDPGKGCAYAKSAPREEQEKCLIEACHLLRQNRELDQIAFRLMLHNNHDDSLHDIYCATQGKRSDWPVPEQPVSNSDEDKALIPCELALR